MNTSHKTKKEILNSLDSLVKSCEEGIDGTWDSSPGFNGEPGNGYDGFTAMIVELEQVIRYVNNQKD